MKLQDRSFDLISNGSKIYEIRLNDEKRQKLKVGDEIIFSKYSDRRIKVKTKIVDLIYSKNFENLMTKVDPLFSGWKEDSSPKKCAQDMLKYYPEEEQNEYGVVAIQIMLYYPMDQYYNEMSTDNPKELLIKVDEEDNIIGSVTRKECHDQSIKPWHRTTHIYIINSKRELLLTQRSLLKDTAPESFVMSSGGHVQYGEEPKITASREIYEELGLKSKLKFIKKYKIDYGFEREFVYVYFGKDDNKPVINEEVKDYVYIDLELFVQKYLNKEIVFPPGAKDVCDSLIQDSLLDFSNF
jgi:isopentenyldiphosphate isomerase/ASC-1-like (ASCH) protein